MKYRLLIVVLVSVLVPALIICQTTSGTSKKGSLIYVRPLPKDTTPPTIEILEPGTDTQRGIKLTSEETIVVEKAELNVRGIARDSGGIAIVYIRNARAVLRSIPGGCEFTGKTLLQPGANTIEVKAVDLHNNASTASITVRYETEEMRRIAVEAELQEMFGKYHALIIAIEQYQDPKINNLDFPVQDAESLDSVLTKEYIFDQQNIHFMKNPTRKDIIRKFDDLADRLTPTDNLLIFYAGHGYWDSKLEQGFWLPADAERSSKADWLSNSQVRDYIRGIKTKHTLLISDACFSGGIFRTRAAFADAPKSTQELVKLTSRKAMTSGTMKEVPDKSVFVMMLKKRLLETPEKFISAGVLFSSFREAVINNSPNGQVPQFGEIRETGDEGGDFIFVRR